MLKIETCNIDGIHTFEVTVFNPSTDSAYRPNIRAKVGLRVGDKPVAEVSIEKLEEHPEVLDAVRVLITEIELVAANVVGEPGDTNINTSSSPPRGLLNQEI